MFLRSRCLVTSRCRETRKKKESTPRPCHVHVMVILLPVLCPVRCLFHTRLFEVSNRRSAEKKYSLETESKCSESRTLPDFLSPPPFPLMMGSSREVQHAATHASDTSSRGALAHMIQKTHAPTFFSCPTLIQNMRRLSSGIGTSLFSVSPGGIFLPVILVKLFFCFRMLLLASFSSWRINLVA